MDVLRDILKELKELCAEVHDLCAFSQCSITLLELSWKTLRQTNAHISELLDHFVPLEINGEGSRVENKEGSREEWRTGKQVMQRWRKMGWTWQTTPWMRLCSK